MAKNKGDSAQDTLLGCVFHTGQSSGLSDGGCFLFGSVSAQVSHSAMQFGLRDPQVASSRPRYSSVSRATLAPVLVLRAVSAGDKAHIRATTVQPVPVDVIHDPIISGKSFHEFTMQQNGMLPILSLSRRSDSVPLFVDTPAPLHDEGVVRGIDHKMTDDVAMSVHRYGTMGRHRAYSSVSAPDRWCGAGALSPLSIAGGLV